MNRRPMPILTVATLLLAAAFCALDAAAQTSPPAGNPASPPANTPSEKASAAPATRPATASWPDGRNADKAGALVDEYVIGAGDVLQISVWKEPDASVASAVVRPEGNIGMPLLKEVAVAGLTPRQAERLIAGKLSTFINAPDVTVVVAAINSKKIYIIGAARKEGPITYTYQMTIMQALSEAGGLNEYAKRKKIYVLRHENGRDFRFPFDYDAVLRGERMELNIPLRAGDTVVVPH